MKDERLTRWEPLFARVLMIVDDLQARGTPLLRWSFGGGTALMLTLSHRVSKDVDIFVPDPSALGYVSPRLNDVVESLTGDYIESALFTRLVFAEGEIDFIAAGPLTKLPWVSQRILGRDVLVETPAEILAKKIRYRAEEFKARDILDVAMTLRQLPGVSGEISPWLAQKRTALLNRLELAEARLREDFEAIDRIDTSLSFDECTRILREAIYKTIITAA